MIDYIGILVDTVYVVPASVGIIRMAFARERREQN